MLFASIYSMQGLPRFARTHNDHIRCRLQLARLKVRYDFDVIFCEEGAHWWVNICQSPLHDSPFVLQSLLYRPMNVPQIPKI